MSIDPTTHTRSTTGPVTSATGPSTDPAVGPVLGPENAENDVGYLAVAELIGRLLLPSYRLARSMPSNSPTPTLSERSRPMPARPARLSDSEAAHAAAAWLGRELDGVLTAQNQAHVAGHHTQAITCCEVSYVAGIWFRRYRLWEASHHVGIASASAIGDHAALAGLRTQLATALIAMGRTQDAATVLEQAQYAARASNDPAVEAAVEAGLGELAHARRDYSAALACWKHARELYEYADRSPIATDGTADEIADAVTGGASDMVRRIGVAWRDSGNPDGLAAAEHFLSEAVDAADPAGPGANAWLHARALADLGAVHATAGRLDTALGLLDRARAGMDAIACHAETADIDLVAGDALAARGAPQIARDRYGHAKAIYRSISAAAGVTTSDERLAQLPAPQPGMDPAEVARRAKAIPELLDGDLTPAGARLAWQCIRSGKWTEALDAAVADLRASKTYITAAQHAHLTQLVDGLGEPRVELDLLLKRGDRP